MTHPNEMPAIESAADEFEAAHRRNNGYRELAVTLARSIAFETAVSREVKLENGLREARDRLRRGDAAGALSCMNYALRAGERKCHKCGLPKPCNCDWKDKSSCK